MNQVQVDIQQRRRTFAGRDHVIVPDLLDDRPWFLIAAQVPQTARVHFFCSRRRCSFRFQIRGQTCPDSSTRPIASQSPELP